MTKEIIRSELALGEIVDLAGPFALHHVRNTGIAFGLFPGADRRCLICEALFLQSFQLVEREKKRVFATIGHTQDLLY